MWPLMRPQPAPFQDQRLPNSPAQKLPLPVLAGVALSVGLAPFNSTLIAVALPDIGAELGVPDGAGAGHSHRVTPGELL